jgi:hypothetical protein
MNRILLAAATVALTLTSCYFPRTYGYKLNTRSGVLELTYHDIRSEAQEDSSRQTEFAELRGLLTAVDTLYDSGVVALKGREMFQEDSVLSGRRTYQIRCPKCFPSNAAMLEYALRGNFEAKVQDHSGTVLMLIDTNTTVVSTNAEVLKGKNAVVLAWGAEDTVLQFALRSHDTDTAGTSLLPYYLKDREQSKPPAATKPAKKAKR